MLKYTETDKWKDAWFTSLKPLEKLLFIYLYENCDEAGFIEVNYPLWVTQLNITKDDIYKSLIPLKKALLSGKSTGSNILWIRKYLDYQNKTPLNCIEHASIIKKIRSNINKFSDKSELDSILPLVDDKKNKRLKNDVFIKPTIDEFENYFLEEFPDTPKDDILNMYDHYQSCDWCIGKDKKMSDWKAAIRKNARKNYNKQKNGVKSRTQTTFEVVNEMKQ